LSEMQEMPLFFFKTGFNIQEFLQI
jgi:hypothetical protein